MKQFIILALMLVTALLPAQKVELVFDTCGVEISRHRGLDTIINHINYTAYDEVKTNAYNGIVLHTQENDEYLIKLGDITSPIYANYPAFLSAVENHLCIIANNENTAGTSGCPVLGVNRAEEVTNLTKTFPGNTYNSISLKVMVAGVNIITVKDGGTGVDTLAAPLDYIQTWTHPSACQFLQDSVRVEASGGGSFYFMIIK